MKRRFLNSKIHKATVTDSRIDYEGSCETVNILLQSVTSQPSSHNQMGKCRLSVCVRNHEAGLAQQNASCHIMLSDSLGLEDNAQRLAQMTEIRQHCQKRQHLKVYARSSCQRVTVHKQDYCNMCWQRWCLELQSCQCLA